MKGILNNSQLDYVLFHLSNHVHLTPEVRESFSFVRSLEETRNLEGRIIFLLSDRDVDANKAIRFRDIPILFPVLTGKDIFFIDDHDNLVFFHDLIKSSFYLLSGYQEYANPDSKDNLNRFSFTDSIQHQLNFIDKPIVNYYFDFIIEGIELFLDRRSKTVVKRRLFSNFGFVLTHDIDKIDLYDINYLVYKIKEIVHLRKSRLPTSDNVKIFVKGLLNWLHLVKKENPYWNFDFLRELERAGKLRSIFFFLDQGVMHSDAYYSFSEERMVMLFTFLQEEKCEIGLHGPVRSIDDQKTMEASLNNLRQASRAPVTGNRQHRLLWKHPLTAQLLEAGGLQYDCTLGFAAHEGFRNSYCLPFKLYDFDNDKMIDLWEFPLNVMDGTLFAYREYTTSQAMEKCMALVNEISKFGGLFSLLWHNSFFDEVTYPGVTKFYRDLLENVVTLKPENVLGSELLEKIKSHSSR